jgi:hypothetical protein
MQTARSGSDAGQGPGSHWYYSRGATDWLQSAKSRSARRRLCRRCRLDERIRHGETGSSQIVEYLRGLFADANFDAGQPVAPPEARLRRLTDDVVIVSTHAKIRGQGLAGGGEITLRDNHALHVLQRQPDARWVVVSELFMDARTDQTYVSDS